LYKVYYIIFSFFVAFQLSAQRWDTLPFNRKDEILYQGKRYAIHNNFLLLGLGYNFSTLHKNPEIQSTYGLQFVFHIRRQHFHAGLLVAGRTFQNTLHTAVFAGYGYRKEHLKYNWGVFTGPSYNFGILPPEFTATDTIPASLYDKPGWHVSAHYIRKILFDIGIGAEVFFNWDVHQSMGGVRLVLFFSGSYRGKENRVNRYVKFRIPG